MEFAISQRPRKENRPHAGVRNETPADIIARQRATIERAIELLQREIDAVTFDSDCATWSDACQLSHSVDTAKRVIETLGNGQV
jgi:hypothetical protein